MTVIDKTQLEMRMNLIEVLMEKFPKYPPERIATIALMLEQTMSHKMAGVKLE